MAQEPSEALYDFGDLDLQGPHMRTVYRSQSRTPHHQDDPSGHRSSREYHRPQSPDPFHWGCKYVSSNQSPIVGADLH